MAEATVEATRVRAPVRLRQRLLNKKRQLAPNEGQSSINSPENIPGGGISRGEKIDWNRYFGI